MCLLLNYKPTKTKYSLFMGNVKESYRGERADQNNAVSTV